MSQRRILFVDDEPGILDGLRRLLRKQRSEWEMEFVASGAEALTRMATCPFDVLVTDLQMPGMNGAELLEQVHLHYPATARIALSAHAGEDLMRRALSVTHRFMAKPVDADKLMATVREACAAHAIVPDERLRALIGGCETLPSSPTLYVELSRVAASESADARAVAEVIMRDMAMSAKLLQLVNSAFFGIEQRVSSVERTVALLGFTQVKALVLSEQIFQTLRPAKPMTQMTLDRLWRHSLRIAEMARGIARLEKQTGDRPDQAFMAGLLHDIGLLVLASRQTEALDEICRDVHERDLPLHALEQERWGICHADVGAFLLQLWGLPPRIVEAVRAHHTPMDVDYNGICALTAVHVADALEGEVQRQRTPRGDDLFAGKLDHAYLERAGLTGHLPMWMELAQAMQARPWEQV